MSFTPSHQPALADLNHLHLPLVPEKLGGIVSEAAKIVRNIFESGGLITETKADGSFVTNADMAVHNYLKEHLPGLVNAVVVSEEEIPDYSVRKNSEALWLIDPVDNTKGIVEGSLDNSSVNIALLADRQPVLGLVHYFGSSRTLLAIKGGGAFELSEHGIQPLPGAKAGDPLRFVSYRGSLDEMTEQTRGLLERAAPDGVSLVHRNLLPLRLKAIMTGEADVYIEPRVLREWDVVPAFAFMNAAGGSGVSLIDGSPVKFNNEDLKVGPFMLARPGVDVEKILRRIARSAE